MVDITQSTIMGYAITPWFISLCSCIVGTIVFTILVVLGFSKRDSKEREMIENAVKNTSGISAKNIEMPIMDFVIDSYDETELIVGDKTGKTDSFKTEGFDSGTEGLELETDELDLTTEGLVTQTERLDMKTEAFADDRTDGFDGEESRHIK